MTARQTDDHTPPHHQQDRLLDHTYDGIQEFDNPLPRWWIALFWATMLFAPMYFIYYHFGPGELEIEQYDAAMVAFYDRQAQELLALGEIDDQLIQGLETNQSMINNAAKLYQAKCATCHGMLGEGGIGPNLTDTYWIHGGTATEVYTTITQGVPEKGMLAWERQLKPAELLAMAAYVGTLRGTSPSNAKAPEGDLYEPEVEGVTITEDQPPADQPQTTG